MATYNGHNEDASGNILLGVGNGMTNTIETGTTASQAYTKGSYLYFNNRLCKAITPIAKNAALTVGTNIAYTSMGEELTSHLKSSDGNEFYFDYQNGKYGYNTSAGRGADTFHSFKGDMSVYLPTSLQADYWAGVDGGWGVATMSLVAPSDGSLTYTNVNITSGSSIEEPSVLNGIGAYLLINGNSAISAHPEYDATNYPINQSASFTEGQTLTFQIWLFVKTHPANQPQAHLNWTWNF